MPKSKKPKKNQKPKAGTIVLETKNLKLAKSLLGNALQSFLDSLNDDAMDLDDDEVEIHEQYVGLINVMLDQL